MILTVYSYPTESGSFQEEKLFQTDKVNRYEYEKKWTGTGNFTLTLSADDTRTNKIVENCVLNYSGDWLFVNNVKRENSSVVVTGTDLTGWLDLRITAFGETQVAGADGYDVVKGTTGECVNHYIANNMTSPEDRKRKIPRLVIGQTAEGKAEDSYMARLQVVEEVVANLCKKATIGFEITADVVNNRFIFNTLTGVDRSVEQAENSVVVFSQKRNNIFSAIFERGNAECLNAIYATGADVTQLVTRDDNVPTGILRRETAIDVSVDTVADIKDYALNATSGNIENNSYTLDVKGWGDYGVKYNLGDYVTVKDVITSQTWTAQIVATKKIISQTEQKIVLTLGDAKIKLLNKIQNSVVTDSTSTASRVQNSISDATATITGAKGGYVILHTNENNKPYEILIMDTEDIHTAQKVWRWNSGGFGYSSNGYDGPYETAITMDGAIIADFVSAGTLQGVKVICDNGDVGGWTIDGTGLSSPDGTIKIMSKQTDTGGKIELYRVSPAGTLDLTCTLEKGGVYLSYNDSPRGHFFVDSGNSNMSYLDTDYATARHIILGSTELTLKTATLQDGSTIQYLGV